jgi:hypothetical protein
MCRDGDLHLTPAGQHFVAQLIIEQLRHGRR